MGTTTYSVSGTYGGFTYSSTKDVVDISASHAYSATYEWAADGSSCTVHIVCANDADHNHDIVAVVESSVKIPATCTEMGTTTYSVSGTYGGFTYSSTKDVVDIDALGHSYAATYDWSADGKTCIVNIACSNDASHNAQVNAQVSSSKKTDPTCTENGLTTYSVSGTYDGFAYSSTKDVADIQAIGHDYSATYGWADNGSACIVHIACANNAGHNHDIVAAVGSSVKIPATCTEIGTTTYSVSGTYDGFTYSSTKDLSDISALGHDLIHHDAKAPTNAEVGWEAYDTCSRCDYTTYMELPRLGYSVRFMNGDTVMAAYVLAEGTAIVAPSEIPEKAADKVNTYVFSSWSGYTAGMTATRDVDFTAIYTSVPVLYTIKFMNDDCTVISEVSSGYGEAIVIPTVTKDSTAQYEYAFRYWTDSQGNEVVIPATVEDDIAAYASFTQTDRRYTATFFVEGVEYAKYVLYYGNTIVSPAENPTKASDDTFDYSFFGWEGYTTGMVLTKSEIFNAVFTKTVKVTSKDSGEYEVRITDNVASFTAETVADIVEQAKANSAVTMSVSLGEGVITFDNTALRTLEESGLDLIISKLAKNEMTANVRDIVGDNVAYSITFGNNKTFGNGKVTVTLPYQLDSGKDADKLIIYYIADGHVAEEMPCLYNDGYVTFVTNHFSTYAVMYVDSESEQGFPIMYMAIGAIGVLALFGGLIAVKRRH